LQESGCHGHRDTFVPIHERMVLREALLESGRFLNQVTVVPAAGPGQSRLQRSTIPDAPGASEPCDQFRVNGNRLFDCGISSH
jgi:hypothetical protein